MHEIAKKRQVYSYNRIPLFTVYIYRLMTCIEKVSEFLTFLQNYFSQGNDNRTDKKQKAFIDLRAV